LPWNPDETPLESAVVNLRSPPEKRVRVKEIFELQKRLRGTKPYVLWFREKLSILLAGESLGQPGERDTEIWKLVCAILEEIPSASAESLGAVFAPSLATMALEAPGCPTLENVVDKIARKKTEATIEVALDQSDEEQARKRAIRLAFSLSTRETPYTQAEAQAFTEALGLPDTSFLTNFWLVQKGDSYYVLVAGVYKGPFTWAELERSAQMYLAPAHSLGVRTHETNQFGETQAVPARTLVERYGVVANRVVVDWTAQVASYNPVLGVLTEAPCPFRVLTPEFSPEIDQWLALLGGETAHKLNDWLAVVTRIGEPCAALYLEGAKGVGKSLLAEGVARLWTTTGPVALVDAMAQFNESVLRCPLVFADESVPVDFRGKARTGELRQMIQARTRALKRKYQAEATMHGCIRMVLAANNGDLLNTSEHLTINDIEAIVDRVVHIDANQATGAREFLESLPRETITGWVAGDGIARHCLWLANNRGVHGGGRFLVSGDKSALHRRLTVSTGLRSAVCCWLVGYLLEPKKFDANRTLLVRVHQGRLLVNVRALAGYWLCYDTNTKAPATGEMARALAGLCSEGTVKLNDGAGTRTHYRVADTGNLISWASDCGFADAQTIERALGLPG
jgi:hypothetical protein